MDSGDLLFPPGSIPISPVGRAKEMAAQGVDLYIKTYNLMGYDAFTPGEIDLSWGIDALKKLHKQTKFKFLLANLFERRTQKPVFQPYLIKEMGGIKIGLLGLISNRFSIDEPPEDKEKYLIGDPIEAATKIVAELKERRCLILIALAHMEESEQRKLAQAFPKIHLIVSGHVRNIRPEPLEVNDNQIMNAGTRGEYVGQMDFFVKEEKKEKILSSHFQLIALRDLYLDHYQAARLVEEFKMKLTEIKYLKQETVIQEAALESQDQPLSYAIPSFAGDESCLPCHPQQHQQWKRTSHSRAYQTLIKNNRTEDLTCLPCHTTGYGEVSDSGAILQNVQCEVCHGARGGHPESHEKSLPVNERECRMCHTPDKSPRFNFATYLQKIKCNVLK